MYLRVPLCSTAFPAKSETFNLKKKNRQPTIKELQTFMNSQRIR